MRSIPALSIFASLAICAILPAQATSSLDQVKRIYVGSFGDKADSGKLRDSLISELGKHHRLTVVDSPDAADAILKGSGAVWIKGYYSLNPRVREVGPGASPVYGGFLSVELTGKKDEPLWSWLVTPHRAGSGDISRDLAGEIARRLDDSVASAPHRR
jgi:hypothetical protein